ncbi:MAG: hypothetical protein BGO30_03725 [Bacteroidetes bacterium 41-46]|nr:MAG: hypothetical protein BGO30_03725 [Bacteroidetes bacterium 41-46]
MNKLIIMLALLLSLSALLESKERVKSVNVPNFPTVKVTPESENWTFEPIYDNISQSLHYGMPYYLVAGKLNHKLIITWKLNNDTIIYTDPIRVALMYKKTAEITDNQRTYIFLEAEHSGSTGKGFNGVKALFTDKGELIEGRIIKEDETEYILVPRWLNGTFIKQITNDYTKSISISIINGDSVKSTPECNVFTLVPIAELPENFNLPSIK